MPTGTRKAWFEGRKGPRQTGQAQSVKTEEILLKTKEPPAQKEEGVAV